MKKFLCLETVETKLSLWNEFSLTNLDYILTLLYIR